MRSFRAFLSLRGLLSTRKNVLWKWILEALFLQLTSFSKKSLKEKEANCAVVHNFVVLTYILLWYISIMGRLKSIHVLLFEMHSDRFQVEYKETVVSIFKSSCTGKTRIISVWICSYFTFTVSTVFRVNRFITRCLRNTSKICSETRIIIAMGATVKRLFASSTDTN